MLYMTSTKPSRPAGASFVVPLVPQICRIWPVPRWTRSWANFFTVSYVSETTSSSVPVGSGTAKSTEAGGETGRRRLERCLGTSLTCCNDVVNLLNEQQNADAFVLWPFPFGNGQQAVECLCAIRHIVQEQTQTFHEIELINLIGRKGRQPSVLDKRRKPANARDSTQSAATSDGEPP